MENPEVKKRKWQQLVLPTLLVFGLGMAPWSPEPHLFGKVRWVLGGANGMMISDWFDLLLHGSPFVYFTYVLLRLFSK